MCSRAALAATSARNRPLLVLATAVLYACGGNSAGLAGTVVRDSAGIRIVQNPAEAPDLRWSVSSQPVVQIGGTSAGEAYELFQIRGATRLADGRIVVANAGSYELRYYDSAGTFIRSAGRRGGGPGEFEDLRWLRRLPGDSVITYDTRHLRFSVFDNRGTFARSFAFDATDSVPFADVIDMYSDGSFLAQGFVNTGGVSPDGMQRYEKPLYHFADDGALLTVLGMFLGNQGYFKSFPIAGGFSFYDPFFPLESYHVVAGDRLYIAENDTYELRRYTPDGALTDIVRRAHTPISVTREHIAVERERRLAATRSSLERERTSNALNEMSKPETFPAYQGVHVDDELNVWVQEYNLPSTEQSTWSVFDSTGILLGQIEMPLTFEPYQIGADFVLGKSRDEFDTEYVQLFALVKP